MQSTIINIVSILQFPQNTHEATTMMEPMQQQQQLIILSLIYD